MEVVDSESLHGSYSDGQPMEGRTPQVLKKKPDWFSGTLWTRNSEMLEDDYAEASLRLLLFSRFFAVCPKTQDNVRGHLSDTGMDIAHKSIFFRLS